MTQLETAALSLHDFLFADYYTSGAGYVEADAGRLVVFLYMRETEWKGPRPSEWEGWNVTWKFEIEYNVKRNLKYK